MKCHVCRAGNLIRQQIGWSCDRCKVAVRSAVPRYRIYPMPSTPASVIETPDGEWCQWQDIQEEMTALRSAAEKLQALVAELTNELCIARSAVECPPLTPYSDTGGTEANAETVKGFASVIAQQAARVAELEAAVALAAKTFRQYQDIHMLKYLSRDHGAVPLAREDQNNIAKSEKNRDLAEVMERALAGRKEG